MQIMMVAVMGFIHFLWQRQIITSAREMLNSLLFICLFSICLFIWLSVTLRKFYWYDHREKKKNELIDLGPT